MAEKRPEKVFRIGFVSVSIFAHEIDNDGDKRTVRSVSLQKRFRDGDEWKYTSSLSLAELPQAMRLLELATRHVESREA
ncbi:MAG: hypothetical protein KDA88_23845 [Planctomycetaceae bacterium]|nr:hypothetical protein [Planctomycetaceae bacterium]MCB9952148.1 hypothetical protein [Planctomycetaceae bacterium]